jgi:chromosome segregation ATPase
MFELELQNRNLIEQKQNEIENLNEQLFELKRKYELLNTEYDTLKTEIDRHINHLDNRHKSEVKELMFEIQLLNEKAEAGVDRETFKNVRMGKKDNKC